MPVTRVRGKHSLRLQLRCERGVLIWYDGAPMATAFIPWKDGRMVRAPKRPRNYKQTRVSLAIVYAARFSLVQNVA